MFRVEFLAVVRIMNARDGFGLGYELKYKYETGMDVRRMMETETWISFVLSGGRKVDGMVSN